MMRLRVSWTGPGVVGPSVTTFFGVGAPTTFRGAVVGFLQAQAARLPDDVQLSIPNSGDEINAATGAIEGSWSSGTAAVVNGTSTAAFAIGTGLRYVWETAGITRGRHVRGSTYLVPVSSALFDTTGRLLPAVQNSMVADGNTLLTNAQGTLVVWTRPKGFLPGAFNPVIGVAVPENPTSLRSRRT
jgi:hypothetical protein